MRTMRRKKWLAMLLAIMMVISLFPTAAFAEQAAGLTWFSPDVTGTWQGNAPTEEADKFHFEYAASNDRTNLKLFVKYHGALTGNDETYGNGNGTNFRIWLQLPEAGYTSYNYLIDVSKKATTWDSQMKHNTAPAGNTGETVYAYGSTPTVDYTVTETADDTYLQMTIPLSAIDANSLMEKQVNMVVTVSNKVEKNYCLHSNNCGEGAHLATTWSKDGYAILKPNQAMYLYSKYPQEADPEPVAIENAAKIVRGGVDIQTYNTLNEAITAAENGDTVVLLKAQNMGNVKITKNITLDLGDFTCRVNSMVLGLYNQGDYNITVQNGTITAGSTSTGASGGDGDGIFFANGAPGREDSNVHTFKKVTFTLNGISKGNAIFHNRSKLVFEDCVINATNSKGNLLYNNGTAPQIHIKDSTVTASNLDGGLCQSWSEGLTASAKGGFITAAVCGITFDYSSVTATNLHAMPLNQQTINVTNGSVVSINATGTYLTAKGINQSVVNVSGTGSKLTLSGLTNQSGGNLIGINCSSVNVSDGGALEIKDLPGSCAFQQCCLTADNGTVNVNHVNEAVYNAYEDEKIVLKNNAVMTVTNIGDEAFDVLNGNTSYHNVIVELNSGATLNITDSAYSGIKNCDLTMSNATLNISGMGSTGINRGTTTIGTGSVVNISDCDKGNFANCYDDNTCIRATGTVTIAGDAQITCEGRVYSDTNGDVTIRSGKYGSVAAADNGAMTLYGGLYTVRPDDTLAAEGYQVIDTPAGAERTAGYIYTIGHTILITPGIHGTVTTTPANGARESDRVVVTPTPDAGYYVSKLTYTISGDATEYPISRTDDQYSFTMPASDVEINAVFEVIPPAPQPEIVVPVSGDKNEVEVKAEIEENNAKVETVTKEEIAKVGTGEAVTIDVSNVEVEGKKQEISEVTLTKETVENVKESEASGLEIKLTTATVVIDQKTLEAVSAQAEGNEIHLVVDKDTKAEQTLTEPQKETIVQMTEPVVLDAYFVSNGKRISDFQGGKVKILVEYPTYKPIKVWYVADDGTKEEIPSSFNATKQIASFEAEHFSHYVVETIAQDGFIATGTAKKSTNTIKWNAVVGADGYDLFFAECGKTAKKVKSTTALKYTKKSLNSKKVYKYYVKAYQMVDGKKTYIAKTPTIHVAGSKAKYSNATKLTVNVKEATLELGKVKTIKAKITKKSSAKTLLWKNHTKTKIRFMSSDKKVATVNSNGKITATGAGEAYIYAYSPNGVYKKITVKVAE